MITKNLNIRQRLNKYRKIPEPVRGPVKVAVRFFILVSLLLLALSAFRYAEFKSRAGKSSQRDTGIIAEELALFFADAKEQGEYFVEPLLETVVKQAEGTLTREDLAELNSDCEEMVQASRFLAGVTLSAELDGTLISEEDGWKHLRPRFRAEDPASGNRGYSLAVNYPDDWRTKSYVAISQNVLPKSLVLRKTVEDEKGEPGGLIELQLSTDQIAGVVGRFINEKDSVVFIVDESGKKAAVIGRREDMPLFVPATEDFSPGAHVSYSYYLYCGEVEGTNLRTAVLYPTTILAFIGNGNVLLWVFLYLVLWIGLFLFIEGKCERYERRINHICTGIKEVQWAMTHRGYELTPLGEDPESDELESVTTQINELVDTAIMEGERMNMMSRMKRDADLQALQAQINPHFLYNTLELIDFYAFENQPEVVEHIVKSLSNFYKLSLNSGKDLTSLWKEIKLVEAYTDILSYRNSSAIQLKVDVPEEAGQCQLPPMSIQPIVENAILHGIRAKKERTGTVSISAYEEKGDMVILVRDDGVGMSPELINELNQQMRRISDNLVQGNHYGMRNCNQRIRLLFGSAYGITVLEPPAGGGSAIEIRIPAG